MKPVVFLHTNDQQLLAAKVSEYSLRARSRHADKFETRVLRLEETPELCSRFGQTYTFWDSDPKIYVPHDLLSFVFLRRKIPKLMNYSGRAFVVDPDMFAVGDVYDLLSRDMQDKAILCTRKVLHFPSFDVEVYATGNMLLDCAKLKHWQWERELDDVFSSKLMFCPWLNLAYEAEESIGLYEQEWNHCDILNENTKILHCTDTGHQPWKTGLRVDFGDHAQAALSIREMFRRIKRRVLKQDLYLPHPDPAQENYFFSLLLDALEDGHISEAFVRSEILKKHVRPDVFEVLRRTRADRKAAVRSEDAFESRAALAVKAGIK